MDDASAAGVSSTNKSFTHISISTDRKMQQTSFERRLRQQRLSVDYCPDIHALRTTGKLELVP